MEKEYLQRIEELEAMVVHLAQRVEKLEGRRRLAPFSSYLKELRAEARRLLGFR